MTIRGGETYERNYGEPETACILDIDGIQRVSAVKSIRNDIAGADSEVLEGYDDWMTQTIPHRSPFRGERASVPP